MKPVIGITSYARDGKMPVVFSVPTAYVDAVRAVGALPVVFPAGEQDAARLLDIVDGLILSGGGDISPQAYGGRHHETVYSVCEERDAFEFALTRAALARPSLPMLCICRGLQVLNVVCGGTLHAHVPDTYGSDVQHRLPPKLTSRHPARIDGGSRLGRIIAADTFEVCSWHHQAIDVIGDQLTPVAWASDGVIEAVEHNAHPWCFGVQWHPEMQMEDPVQRRLFEALVKEAMRDER